MRRIDRIAAGVGNGLRHELDPKPVIELACELL
jgi:hypothetical protein